VRKGVTLTVKTITDYNKPIQNIKVTVNGTKYFTNTTGYATISTYSGTVNLAIEKVTKSISDLETIKKDNSESFTKEQAKQLEKEKVKLNILQNQNR
jgi:hypothetical protein